MEKCLIACMQHYLRLGLKPIVLVFNNETFRDSYGVIPYLKEPEVCYEGYPHIMAYIIPESKSSTLYLDRLHGKRVEIKFLDKNGKTLSEVSGDLKRSMSPIMPDVLASEIRLNQRLYEARYAQVHLDEFEYQVKMQPFVKVYGKVTDFQGNPRKNAYIMLVNPYGFPGGTAITKTDNRGSYEFYAPAATYHHAFVCDGKYGFETLEFYGWNLVVEPPGFRLDARFDKIEIYRLTAAETPERTVIVEFVPMDIENTTKGLQRIYEKKGKIDPEDMCNRDLELKLEQDDVNLYLDQEELEIRSISQRYYLPKDFGILCSVPAWILEAKIPRSLPAGKYNLKTVIHKIVKGNEEWGESTLFSLTIW